MKLQQLRFLLAVVDNGLNITAAAERLYTSQPGVSKQLRQLEEELGAQLFVRSGRSLAELTPAGREVVARARRVMHEVEAISGLSERYYNETAGELAIGTTHTQARYVLPEVIGRFRERYPQVNLHLHQGTTEQIAQLADDRQIEFAIASGSRHRFGELVLLPCYSWDRTIIVPRDHALARLGRKPTLEELAQHPLVTYVFSFDGVSSLKHAFEAKGLEPEVVFTARDADVIKTYVRMGMGVGVVASMARDCREDSGLVAIDARGLFPRSTTWIGFRRDLPLRRYMVDLIGMFAPHLNTRLVEQAASLPDQAAVDALFTHIEIPVREPCPDTAAGTHRAAEPENLVDINRGS